MIFASFWRNFYDFCAKKVIEKSSSFPHCEEVANDFTRISRIATSFYRLFLNNFNVRSSMINIVFDVTNFVTFSAEKKLGFFTCYCLYNQLQFNEWESVSRNFPNSQQWKTFLFKMGLSWSYFKNTLNKIHFVSNSLKKHITN